MRAKSFVSRGIALMAAIATVLVGVSGTSAATVVAPIEAAHVQEIHNRGSLNKCMDLKSYAAGTAVTLFRCSRTTASQKFDYVGDGTIRSVDTGFCMDISSYNVGAVVHMQRCHGGPSQTWFFRGDYTISPDSSRTLCMDVSSYNDGTPVILYPCNGVSSQEWARW